MTGSDSVLDRDSVLDEGSVLDEDSVLDLLIPPAGSPVRRLVVGVLIVGLSVYVGILFGFGYVYPRPTVNGSASGGTVRLSADGRSIRARQVFANFSQSTLKVTSVETDLPGATVMGTGFATEDDEFHYRALPALVRPGESINVIVDFVPDCAAPPTESQWGRVTLHLKPVSSWLPTIGADYTLDEPLLNEQSAVLSHDGTQVVSNAPADTRDQRAMVCEALNE